MYAFLFLCVLIIIQVVVSLVFIVRDRDEIKRDFSETQIIVGMILKVVFYVFALIIVKLLDDSGYFGVAWALVLLQLFVWILAFIMYLRYGDRMWHHFRRDRHREDNRHDKHDDRHRKHDDDRHRKHDDDRRHGRHVDEVGKESFYSF